MLFDGFGHKESRHNLANGFTWGPDGWLYAGHGRTSPSDVGRPGTPAEQRIHCDGGVYRIHPTRLVFENFADGTTNPWGVDFDDFGQCFVSNCVNPHLFHMIQGGHYEPWRNRPSSLYAYERLPTCADHLHFPGGKPERDARRDSQETLALGGGHAHCGTLIYLGDNFPAAVPQHRLHVQRPRPAHQQRHAAARRLRLHRQPRQGLHDGRRPLVHGRDAADRPRRQRLRLRLVRHRRMPHVQAAHARPGRIYKISYGEPRRGQGRSCAKLSDDELVKLQLHANDWYVRHARRLLQERAAKTRLERDGGACRAAGNARRRTRTSPAGCGRSGRCTSPAAWMPPVCKPCSTIRPSTSAAWAIQLLCESGRPVGLTRGARFAELAKSDPSPVVRLYLAAALQRLPAGRRWAIARGLAGHAEDAADANLPLMIWYGIEPLVPADPGRQRSIWPSARRFRWSGSSSPAGSWTMPPSAARRATLGRWSRPWSRPPTPACRRICSRDPRGLAGAQEHEDAGRLARRLCGLSPKATTRAVREHAVMLALVFGDPQAVAGPAPDRPDDVHAGPSNGRRRWKPDRQCHSGPRPAPARFAGRQGPAPHGPARTGLVCRRTPRRQRVLAVYAELTPDEKQDAVATLASRKAFALALLDAVEKKIVARTDLSAYIARQLFALGDEQVTERLRQGLGRRAQHLAAEAGADREVQGAA